MRVFRRVVQFFVQRLLVGLLSREGQSVRVTVERVPSADERHGEAYEVEWEFW